MSDQNSLSQREIIERLAALGAELSPESNEELIYLVVQMYDLALNKALDVLNRPEAARAIRENIKKSFDLVECDAPKCNTLYPRRRNRRFCSDTCRVSSHRASNFERP
jgi:hypothetical protein